MTLPTCESCICQFCLYWWSMRCPFGECYDDHRAKTEPREAKTGEHWSGWSHCELPGEQDHWCRGGNFRPSEECEHFMQYDGQKIVDCVRGVYSEFQDGYKICSMMPCERCIKMLAEKITEGGNTK